MRKTAIDIFENSKETSSDICGAQHFMNCFLIDNQYISQIIVEFASTF